jgi:DNA-binding transcriptional LysR family regulator
MNFKTYEYVITLSEERSFSKAAKRLFVSQPSLSQYISRLEGELGVVLFDRGSVPLNLTYEGELYVDAAKKILNINRKLLNAYDESKKLEKGRLNVGITPSKANHPLPIILSVFKKQYPLVELSITESSSSSLEEFLEKGLLDVSVLNLPVISARITSESLLTEKILLAAPADMPFAKDVPFLSFEEIKRFESEKFILQCPGQRLRQIANEVFIKAGIKPKILMETSNIETSLRLVMAGIGCAFIPEMYAENSARKFSPKKKPPAGGTFYFTIGDNPLTWTIGTAFQKDVYLTQAARAFINVTKDVIQEIY